MSVERRIGVGVFVCSDVECVKFFFFLIVEGPAILDVFFFFKGSATTEIYSLSLLEGLPQLDVDVSVVCCRVISAGC